MFHKIKTVLPLPGYELRVQFVEGTTKRYDLKPLIREIPAFRVLEQDDNLFFDVAVDTGGYGIVWNDEIDLACDELWDNGQTIQTPFDDLIALSDATALWDLNESTLRKAISYGKLTVGIDVCKFGKQWIVSKSAMEREYGHI